MTTLTDTQRILLAAACQRDTGSILPLPASIKPGGGSAKAIAALLKQGFAQEGETNDTKAVRRTDGDIAYGVYITSAGGAAIGIDLEEDGASVETDVPTAVTAQAAPGGSPAPRASSKTAAVIALLTRPEGASLADLITVTGWLPHTTRAALTGLRKKGHGITRGKRDGVTCYRIGEAA